MLNIYQVLPRYVGNENSTRKPNGTIEENGCGKLKYINDNFLSYLSDCGYDAIWLTGVLMHATKTDYSGFGIRIDHPGVVKGQAGSPYAIKDYYAIDPDLATRPDKAMREFEEVVTKAHRKKIKVIIDFVPNHVARQYGSGLKHEGVRDLGSSDDTNMSFSPRNNFYYLPGQELRPQFDAQQYYENPAKVSGNDVFSATPSINDWYETAKLNYGVDYQNGHSCHFTPTPDTWKKMTEILLYWAKKGVDGFRCDMAEMVPVEFWKYAIGKVKKQFPNIFFVAEVYNPQQYRDYIFRGGFDYLYDKVGLYDTLKAVTRHETSANDITPRWQETDDIKTHMLNFLENHDEQRLASDFVFADGYKAIPALVVSALLNDSPFMVYFGQELGEQGMDSEGFSGRDGRTSIFDYWSMDSFNRLYARGEVNGLKLTEEERELLVLYARVLQARKSIPALGDGSYRFDLQYLQDNNPDYNRHRCYAFARWKGNSRVLVIANFDENGIGLALNLNAELLKKMGIREGKNMRCRDLLTLRSWTESFSSKQPSRFQIDPYSALVIEIK